MKINKLFILVLLIISKIGFCQSKLQYAKAKVSYVINIHFDKSKKIYEVYEKYRPGLVAEAESIASELDFSLILNDSISVFYLEKKLFSDNRAASFAIRKSGYYGRIKQQPHNYITEELQESFGEFLVSRPYHEWELQDETKVIGDYTCFKATTSYTTTNPKGKAFNHSFTAWYTPQLPYSFGPAGFGDLPGLIIELQSDDYTYGVKKIKFFDKEQKNKENEIPRLKRKKLITEEEFEKLAAEDEKRWRKD
ncbi:GLPGLI family protein [Psychroflexus halocasei]|uniref:GLPGLI family protein n=1 Tax=Psychroflexus halocasei TaxID=908615 RepID=A0A1H4B1H2_9FLAO|nr:GLPGLI family protein [Psychroflexus halocasei]SEA41878.1 GLPGLI family protein [Psychroflexus halocasei]